MNTNLPPLGALIAGWPEHAPVDGPTLILCDDEALTEAGVSGDGLELVRNLRTHLRTAATARGTSTQLQNAPAVVAALNSGDLRPYWGRWMAIVLDSNRRRVFAPRRNDAGTSRTVVHLSKWVPEPDSERLPHLPENGCYLFLWGGSPDILAIDDVRERLRAFAAQHPVADVVFRKPPRRNDAGAPTTWSLREGVGVCGDAAVPFPEESHHEEVNLWT